MPAAVATREGGDIEIIFDTEYETRGRLCGTDRHPEGGWWLPIEDDWFCTDDEDSAEEVGIQPDGSMLASLCSRAERSTRSAGRSRAPAMPATT